MLWMAIAICASVLASMAISALFYRLLHSKSWAVACGSLGPAVAIIAVSVYLGGHRDYGLYYSYIGLILALMSVLIGIPVAIWATSDRDGRDGVESGTIDSRS